MERFARSCRTEASGEKLWLPPDSEYNAHNAWKESELDDRVRDHYAMISHPDNVLTSSALLHVRNLHF